ncbi:MAG: lipoprotein [Dokdonella sp.]
MSRSFFKPGLRALALAALLLSLAACGQKGDLVKPGSEPAKASASSGSGQNDE